MNQFQRLQTNLNVSDQQISMEFYQKITSPNAGFTCTRNDEICAFRHP